jgi:hypothetical protein
MKKDLEKSGLDYDRLWRRETAATPSWPPTAGHPTLPLSPWYFEEKEFAKNHRNWWKKTKKKVALIKTDYEEGRLQPPAAGHPIFPLLKIFWRKKNSKKIIEIDVKRLRKKWPWLRQTMKKGYCSHPQLATPLFLSPQDIFKKKIREKS